VSSRRITRNTAGELRNLAEKRIERLLKLAGEVFRQYPERADRYVELAWKIKTRYNVRLPSHLKRKFCRKCLSFWVPGFSCRVRLHSGRVNITCLRCGRVVRLPYRPRALSGKKRKAVNRSQLS